MSAERPRLSPHFFKRDGHGNVQVRLKFRGDEASLFEEAAGKTPVMVWLYQTLNQAAQEQVDRARAERPEIAPPE